MKKKKLLTLFGSICLVLVLAALLLPACAKEAPAPPAPAPPAPAPPKPAPPKPVEWTARAVGTGSGYYPYCVAVGNVINKGVPEVHVTMMAIASSKEARLRMVAGELDCIIVSATPSDYMLYHGIQVWEGKGDDRVRSMWALSADAYTIFVREDSGITTLEELDGKPFSPGAKGTTTDRMARATLEAIGIQPDYFIGSFEDMKAAFKDRAIVGFTNATAPAAPNALILEIMASTEIRILNWPPETHEAALKAFPGISITPIPPGVYPYDWNKGPVNCLSAGLQCTTMNYASEDLVYKIVKAVYEDYQNSQGIQISAFPAIERPRSIPERTMSIASVPLHKGALRFYRELGIQIPDNLIPPEAK